MAVSIQVQLREDRVDAGALVPFQARTTCLYSPREIMPSPSSSMVSNIELPSLGPGLQGMSSDCGDGMSRNRGNVDRSPRFKKGDVVRANGVLGVVLAVGGHPGPPPWWELYVDGPDGVAVWPPEGTALAADTESVEEALRLGLRGLDPEAEATWVKERAERTLPGEVRQQLLRQALASDQVQRKS
jgi:hypothetical protein